MVEGSRILREHSISLGHLEGRCRRGKSLIADYVLAYRVRGSFLITFESRRALFSKRRCAVARISARNSNAFAATSPALRLPTNGSYGANRLTRKGRFRPVNVFMQDTAGDSFIVRRTTLSKSRLSACGRPAPCRQDQVRPAMIHYLLDQRPPSVGDRVARVCLVTSACSGCPQGIDDVQIRGAQRRQKSTHQSHGQRKCQRGHYNARRQRETKRQLGKGLKVGG